MKAKELMVGDYVFWNWVTHKVDFDGAVITDKGYEVNRRIIKVSSVNETGVTFKSPKDGSQIYVKEEDLSLIPLTKKILHKNGFIGEVYLWIDAGNEKVLEYYPFEYRLSLYYTEEKSQELLFRCQCFSVHEFQHALELYGIKKEIVL